MTTRRGSRPTHVRPRPPSDGRPAPVRVRPRAPAPGRLTAHAPVRRSRSVPLLGRLALIVGVVAVGVVVVYLGAGGLGKVASAVSDTMTAFVRGVTATPVPSATPLSVADPPTVEAPAEPYTNQPEADLAITVPSSLAGDPDYVVRVYLALKDQSPSPIDERPLGPSARMIIPVTLTAGLNDFSVTLVGPGGESEQSALVRFVYDTNPASIKVTSPKDGAVINRKAVTVQARTQSRSTVIIRNLKTGESVSGTAGADGTFSLDVPIAKGTNTIRIAVTDPAGNASKLDLSVSRGSGKLRASLSSSAYTILRKNLPTTVRLTVIVDDPDGVPLTNARVTFTLSIPRIPTVTGEATTDEHGQASFETKIPTGAGQGIGSAAVLVRTSEFGRTTDETLITVKK